MTRAGKGAADPLRAAADLTLRVLAAVPLGYAAASLWAMALARVLPVARSEATVIGMLASFAICAAAAMWAFAARSGWLAVWTITAASVAGGAITWLSIAQGGRI